MDMFFDVNALEDIETMMNSDDTDVADRPTNDDSNITIEPKDDEKKLTIEYFATDLTHEAKSDFLDPVI